MNKLILASASPRRCDLLRALGVEFEVIPSRAEELHDETVGVESLCEMNAERKAADISARHPGRVVLGADTLVALAGRLYGKPGDLNEARGMLMKLGGKCHQVITGVCLCQGDRKSVFHEVTEVRFRALSRETIEKYLVTVPVLDKAGAYGIQEQGELLVEQIAGSFSNVVGLPIERLARELEAWGIPYSTHSTYSDRSR